MVDFNYFWEIMCMCYFLGGLTIGYYFKLWRDGKKKKIGTGRWDYKDRHLDDKK